MAQIQQVLLKGKGGNESSEYDPSKAVAEFPRLQENSAESGAIDFQDWLYLVEQQVGSLAAGASTWWAAMLDAAMKAYGKYQSSTPIQRLSVTSELAAEWEDPKYSKLEKRVSALLVGALPQQMKEEMVAYRVRRVHQQLFRLLVNYQPGGSTDRALVLAQLEPKDCPADAAEVVAALRRWFRWLQRAQDLQLSLPDPSVQIRSLSAITKKLADKNADLQFKIALAKTELRVESRPTQDTALRFFQHLLAEAEQLGPAKTQRNAATANATTSSTTTVDPKTKGAQVTPKSQPTSPKDGKGEGKGQVCKWFLTDQGCGRGRGCRYLHDWTQVVKAERCLVCGSKLHKVRDCPRKDTEPAGDGSTVKGLNKKELKVAVASPPAPPSTTQAQAQPTLQQASVNVDAMTAAAKAAADPPLPPPSGDALREALAETNRVLKALTTPAEATTTSAGSTSGALQDPFRLLQAQLGTLRRLQRASVNSEGERVALLDSGASHAYRSAYDEEERNKAVPVNVKLAQGEATILQNQAGTLIGEDRAETLVPLGQLVEVLNCKVHWTKGRLTVLHPVHGRLRVKVRDFCPELAEHEALRLIAELEQKRLEEMGETVRALEMKVAECEYQMEWFDHVKNYVASGERVDLLASIASAPFFKDLSMDFKAMAAEGVPTRDKDGWLLLKAMPWSRRRRRTLYQSHDWNLHLFSGPSGKKNGSSTANKLSQVEATGPKVDVDLLDSNLMDLGRANGVYKLLLWAAAQGRLRTIIGGPPRRSYFSVDPERRVKEDGLKARMLILGMVAMEGRKQWRNERVGFSMEHPNVDDETGFWTSPMWRNYARAYDMQLWTTGRGATGTNMNMRSIEPLTSSTTSGGAWTDDYIKCVESAVMSWNGFAEGDSVLCYMLPGENFVRIGKMTAKEWQLHVQRDHLPFRRDCRHCVQAASGRPHRRVTHRSAYVLSADVAGPFRSKGKATDTNQHRFMLVCAYQFPRLPGTSEVQEESVEEDRGAGIGEMFCEEDEVFHDHVGVAEELDQDDVEFLVAEAIAEAEGEPILDGRDAAKNLDKDPAESRDKDPAENLYKDPAEGCVKDSDPEREAAEASEPFEYSMAYFIRPLRSRKSGEALRALQEIYIDLKMLGLPVNRLHADRAREFRTPEVGEWAASRDIQVTRTEGDAPAQNGAAEQAVKYIKSRTRILLSSAQELSGHKAKDVKTWWPLAAETAAARQRAMAFGQEVNFPAGFGNKVFVKRKRYGAVARDLDPKWGPAIYLGPARDVPGGHIVLTEDGHLWNTCNVRQLADVPMEPDPSTMVTRKRILGKRPPIAPIPLKTLKVPRLSKSVGTEPSTTTTESYVIPELKSTAKMEYLLDKDKMKTLAQVSGEKDWFSIEDCLAILEDIPFRKPNKTRAQETWGDSDPEVYVVFGAYQHGGFSGITRATQKYDDLVKYLVKFLKRHSGAGDPFTSVAVAKNLGSGIHKDRYNIHGKRNVVISLGSFENGGLWIQGEHDGLPLQAQRLPDGSEVMGSVVSTKNCVTKFDPRRWHKSMPWQGTKWSVIGYCNRGFNRLREDDVQELLSYGFPLPPRDCPTLAQLRCQPEADEFDYCETSDEEEIVTMAKMVNEDELVLLQNALDEEEKLEAKLSSSGSKEELQPVFEANVNIMMKCARLEAVSLEEFQKDEVNDSMEWFRLCRMVEGDEQHGVEEVLRNLQSPLQVVYTMSLTEVRENVEAWKQAIQKEVDALISCGALVRMDAAEEDRLRRENRLVVLPAKGVFTVKPPDFVEKPEGGETIDSVNQEETTQQEAAVESTDQVAFTKGVPTVKSTDQVAFTKGVPTVKSTDQVAFTEGVPTVKSTDQVAFTEGVHVKSADQVAFTEGVHVKSADQVAFTEGVHDRSDEQEACAGSTSSHRDDRLRAKVSPTQRWFKRKARLVICGNYEKHIAEDLYAGGCQTETLRVMISHASGEPTWDAAVTDIRNAFLLAPMSTDAVYGLRFPKVFLLALGPEWDWLYRVDRALYGFRRSPRLWGLFRDARFRNAKLKVGENMAILKRLTSDENVWKVVKVPRTPQEQEETIAYIIVYVDDIMYLGQPSVISIVHEWLSSDWTASSLTWASSTDGIRFLGLEVYKRKSGYFMCQLGYLTELLRHHELSSGPGARTPCPREWLLGEVTTEQTTYEEPSLRRAQRLTGELLWLSTKSRPDIMHAVASMSSLCLRDPILVERIGLRALSYLYSTLKVGLMFSCVKGNEIKLTAFSDASFSPAGGRSVGSSLVTYRGNPVAWKAGRQSLISLSTAECELIEAVSASQLQLGISMLVEELNDGPPQLLLLVDNSATVSLCNDAPGTWRTRHLRVRAANLREAVREGRIEIRHIAGIYQKADLGTKCFEPARLQELMELWGLVHFDESDKERADNSLASLSIPTDVAEAVLAGLKKCWTCALTKLATLLIFLANPAEARGTQESIQVSFPWELYTTLAVFVVAGIAVWELLKRLWQRFNPEEAESREARRLRKLQAAVRDELQGMGLQGTPTNDRVRDRDVMRFSPGQEQTYRRSTTSAASSWEAAPAPPPPAPFPTSTGDEPGFRRRRGGTRDQAVQTEPRRILGEVTLSYGQTLYTTKGGKCIHSRNTCSSLTMGGRVDEKHLCQLCNRG